MSKGRLTGIQSLKSAQLLDMLYKPSELAAEIGVTVRQFYRVYVPLGCPCVRNRGRLFINGVVFHQWYSANFQKTHLRQNQAYCLTCKGAVVIRDVEEHIKGRLSYVVGFCSVCGRRVSRII